MSFNAYVFAVLDVDPATLCPYCDDPLPCEPTRTLSQLLDSLVGKSQPFPRPGNPLGRKAKIDDFMSVCMRHRFEEQLLPEAKERGWPMQIDWDQLVVRVRAMRSDIKALCRDSEVLSHCIFWKKMMQEVRLKGSLAASSLRNQLANFESTQPGYYGERGFLVIYNTLTDLVPLATIDRRVIQPLQAINFVQHVLVPEVAVRL
ncbi:hypothetical protein BDZ89DRAFT_973426, partial [Hymenopellis radicata]